MPVAICFFLSGAAALILQVLWTRMLGHVFGATALAVSTTLTVFMGGLALGSHLAGKRAASLKRPLLTFALLESSIGLYGLLVPFLIDRLPYLQRSLGLHLGSGLLGYAVFRFVIVSAFLILPTTAMGATLPVLAEGVVKRSEQMASQVGLLYAANTAGAVVGASIGGFYLIPTLGLHQTVLIAAAVDLLVAGIVLLLFRVLGESALLRKNVEETPDQILTRLEPVLRVPLSAREERRVLIVFAGSGAAAMTLEVLWTRAVGVVIGASTYSFTLILVTFLVGLAAGAALITRRIDRIKDALAVLAYVELGVGATTVAAMLFLDRMPLWLYAVARDKGATMFDIYQANLGISAAVTLPSTLLLGAVMPLVVRALTPEGEARAGAIVGRAYALNTLGAIVGSFLGGFVVLPLIGVEHGLLAAAAINMGLGAWLTLDRPLLRRRILPLAGLGLLLLLVRPSWDMRTWTSGLFRTYLARTVYEDGWAPSGRILYHRDGVATSVTVDQAEDGVGVSLKVNGKVDASDVGDMPTQVLSGLLPLMLHGTAKSVLVIGYGSGVTPAAALKAPIEKLKVAEIEAAVYEASNLHFAHVNKRPDKDPRATMVVDDGRNFLLTRPERWDVIVSEPSNPWMTGAASLFTADFFRIAIERLEPGGIFLQWLQLYELAPRNIHALLRTFHSVFPYVLVFSPSASSNDTFLIGSREPVLVDRARLAGFFAQPGVRDELLRANVEQPEDLLGLFLLGTEQIPRFVGEGPLNTDDNALIEFGAPKDLLTFSTEDPRLAFLGEVEGHRLETSAPYFVGFDSTPAGLFLIAQRLFRQGRYQDAEHYIEAAKRGGVDVSSVERVLAYALGDDDEPVLVPEKAAIGDEAYKKAALYFIKSEYRDALAELEGIKDVEKRSLAHRFLYAFLCYRQKRLPDAEYLIKDVIADPSFVERYPSTLVYSGRIHASRGHFNEASRDLYRYDALIAKTSSTAE